MRKGLVGLGHLVRVFLLLDRAAEAVGRVHDFVGQTLAHQPLRPRSRIIRQPAQTEGLASFGPYLHRDLVVGAAAADRFDLQTGHDVLERFLKLLQRVRAGFFLYGLKRIVNDPLCNALLAVQHNVIDQLGHEDRVVKRVRQNFSFEAMLSSWHCNFPPS